MKRSFSVWKFLVVLAAALILCTSCEPTGNPAFDQLLYAFVCLFG
jgi:hypothetical protein